MSLITEQLIINNIPFIRTYSDAGYYIHGGSPEADYAEAIDLASLGRTYTETTTLIESDPEPEE